MEEALLVAEVEDVEEDSMEVVVEDLEVEEVVSKQHLLYFKIFIRFLI